MRVLGFVDQVTKKVAEQRRAAELELIYSGRVVAKAQMLFSELAQRFVQIRIPQLGFATQKKYRIQIEKHLLPAFGKSKLHEIDRASVEQWLLSKVGHLGWWTRVDIKGVLSAIFTAAKDWKLFDGNNPTVGVRIGREVLVREKKLLSGVARAPEVYRSNRFRDWLANF